MNNYTIHRYLGCAFILTSDMLTYCISNVRYIVSDKVSQTCNANFSKEINNYNDLLSTNKLSGWVRYCALKGKHRIHLSFDTIGVVVLGLYYASSPSELILTLNRLIIYSELLYCQSVYMIKLIIQTNNPRLKCSI